MSILAFIVVIPLKATSDRWHTINSLTLQDDTLFCQAGGWGKGARVDSFAIPLSRSAPSSPTCGRPLRAAHRRFPPRP
jgi:hypothetical protein